jgi:hypothetical protein
LASSLLYKKGVTYSNFGKEKVLGCSISGCMALCGIMPLRADEQITKLTNELKSNEASFRFHSERLIKTSPVGNVLSEDTVSPGRQKELDALKLVFESLKQQNNEVKGQLS